MNSNHLKEIFNEAKDSGVSSSKEKVAEDILLSNKQDLIKEYKKYVEINSINKANLVLPTTTSSSTMWFNPNKYIAKSENHSYGVSLSREAVNDIVEKVKQSSSLLNDPRKQYPYDNMNKSSYIKDWDVDLHPEECDLPLSSSNKKQNPTSSKYKLDNGECYCYDGEIRKKIDCFYSKRRDTFYPKTHQDAVICVISGEYAVRADCLAVYNTVIIEIGKMLQRNEDVVYVESKFKKFLIPVVSQKHGFDTSIANKDLIVGWKYKESAFTASILVDEESEPIVPKKDITQYSAFDNFYSLLGMKNLTNQQMFNIGAKSPTFLSTEGMRLKFGVELEMSRGYLPTWEARNYNVLAIRDGSLNKGEGGLEIVTGVLEGDTGMFHLQKICNELSKRCLVDRYCGVHAHISGMTLSNKFFVNYYSLSLLIEKEIFSFLPLSRRNNQYCRVLDNLKFNAVNHLDDNSMLLNEDYNKLFKHMVVEKVNNPTFDYNKSKQHPLGPKCGYNHSTPRYCWVNFIPAMFNTRNGKGDESKSIEIRNMSGSLNFTKIKNWLLLNMAIITFVERHPEKIIPGISINEILQTILPKQGNSLIEYFNERKRIFNNAIKEQSVLSEDNDYKENYEELKTIKELIP